MFVGTALTMLMYVVYCENYGWPPAKPEPVAGVFDPRPSKYGSIDRHWGMMQPAYWQRDGFRVACVQCPDSVYVLCWKVDKVNITKDEGLKACEKGRWEYDAW